jgi:hypothetical protein
MLLSRITAPPSSAFRMDAVCSSETSVCIYKYTLRSYAEEPEVFVVSIRLSNTEALFNDADYTASLRLKN